jgi:hypothetical protein
MSTSSRLLALSAGLLLAVVPGLARSEAPTRDDSAALEFFEKKVRPVLVNSCYTCHSADTKASGGLRVDDRNGLVTGGNSGPAIVPGQPEKSLLLQRVTHKDAKKLMPKEGQPLTEEAVADLTTWIKNGSVWPAEHVPVTLGKLKPKYDRLKKEHWAWQPLTDPAVPAVRDGAWPRDDVDRFLLASLEARDLRPVADADRLALLRRVTFDLTGLPPTPAQLDAFLGDTTPQAFERVVDRLLASPQFGERWGRHWLDVARYGESTGPSRNIPYPHAWRYRDYVIDAVNSDIPYDRFLCEQLAGDLLPSEPGPERDRLLTATGFLALGVKDVNQRFKVRFIMDNVDEQIDAVMRSVLGLTVTCARCHDHKFDPIPTTDYYALAGIFTSTDNCAGVRNKMGGGGLDYYDRGMLLALSTGEPPAPAEQVEKLKDQVAKARSEWEAIRDTPEGRAVGTNGQPKQRALKLKYDRLEAELTALTDPAARKHTVHGVRDARVVADTEVRLRGEAEKLGPVVPRGFLTTFAVPGAAPINAKQSGRLELARWLTSPKNPLTPRVLVNRVWHHLFGRGIVSTVDNFGAKGDRPSHPELLDHLANRFLRDGWSLKKLVKTIVLTRAYQLGTEAPATHRAADPGNRLVWRHAPRRLDAEEIRDATLAASGTLSLTRLVGSAAKDFRMTEMRDNGAEARFVRDQAERSSHRSVYLPLLRGVTPGALEAFDPVQQTLVTGSRDTTTVPGQALYLLNSSFVRRQSLTLADALLAEKDANDTALVQKAYRLTLGRSPSDKELERARTYLTEYEAAHRATAPVTQPVDAPKPKKTVTPANPDDIERTPEALAEEAIVPKDARSAAWMSFVQVLFGSAEFRYLR